MGRTGLFAWDNIFFLLTRSHGFVHQSARRADLNTGRAEFTPGILKRRAKCPHLDLSLFIIHKAQGLNPPEIAAYAYAPGATDTKIIVPYKKGLVFKYGKIGGRPFWCCRRDTHVVGHVLEFTVAKQCAASFVFRNIRGALAPAATFLLGTGQAGMTMTSKYRD